MSRGITKALCENISVFHAGNYFCSKVVSKIFDRVLNNLLKNPFFISIKNNYAAKILKFLSFSSLTVRLENVYNKHVLQSCSLTVMSSFHVLQSTTSTSPPFKFTDYDSKASLYPLTIRLVIDFSATP